MEIPLGSKVKDLVTGFEGIATERCEFLNGCIQYRVTPQKVGKDSKVLDSYYIDAQQLKIVSKGIIKAKKVTKKTRAGGPTRQATTFKKH